MEPTVEKKSMNKWWVWGGIALALLGLMAGGAYFGGCLPVGRPGPSINYTKKLVILYESANKTPEIQGVITALRVGEPGKQLLASGIELTIVDLDDVDADDKPLPTITKWVEATKGIELPALLFLDEGGSVLNKGKLPTTAGDILVFSSAKQEDILFGDQPYVDCDFSSQRQYVRGYNEAEDEDAGKLDVESATIVLENENFGAVEPVFEELVPIIPREQWDKYINDLDAAGGGLDMLVTRIYDQKSDPSCTSNATCQSTEILEHFQFGRDKVVHKSAMSLYNRVGGPGSGSSVSANLNELLKRGVLPLDTPENRAKYKHVMANSGYRRCPSGWEETAKNFRGHEYYEIRSYDGFITALLRGYPVVYGRSGHSICAVRPVKKNGVIYVKYANSWHESWGDKGFGYDSERMIRAGASWAFALRSVVKPTLATVELPKEGRYNEIDGEVVYSLAP